MSPPRLKRDKEAWQNKFRFPITLYNFFFLKIMSDCKKEPLTTLHRSQKETNKTNLGSLKARWQLLKQQQNAILNEQGCATKHSLHIPIQILEGYVFVKEVGKLHCFWDL